MAWFDSDRGTWTLKEPDGDAAQQPRDVLAEDPLEAEKVGSLTLGGVGFSLSSVLTLIYKLRAAVARERVAGTLYQFGSTARLEGGLRRAGETRKLTCLRQLKEDDELFDLIDDFASSC